MATTPNQTDPYEGLGRNITPEEWHAVAEEYALVLARFEQLARHGHLGALVQVLLGLLLRVGVSPLRVWRIVEGVLPMAAQRAEMARAARSRQLSEDEPDIEMPPPQPGERAH